jgi:hypothetical protein
LDLGGAISSQESAGCVEGDICQNSLGTYVLGWTGSQWSVQRQCECVSYIDDQGVKSSEYVAITISAFPAIRGTFPYWLEITVEISMDELYSQGPYAQYLSPKIFGVNQLYTPTGVPLYLYQDGGGGYCSNVWQSVVLRA